MNVLIISECRKISLQRTRRIVDLYLERIGRRTWCGVITQKGLIALKKLLKKTASRGTAVSCFWLKKDGTRELLWIVGRYSAFGLNGVVPTDTTMTDMLIHNENKWMCLELISGVVMLAGLLHDIGKSSKYFQKKLRKNSATRVGDIIRHEVISFLLFQEILIKFNVSNDIELIGLFASDEISQIKIDELFVSAKSRIEQNTDNSIEKVLSYRIFDRRFAKCFQRGNKENNTIVLLSFLILSHHKLPLVNPSQKDRDEIYNFEQFLSFFKSVKNSSYEPQKISIDQKNLEELLTCDSRKNRSPLFSNGQYIKKLQKAALLIKSGLLSYTLNVMNKASDLSEGNSNDALVVMLSRSILMMADHYVSSWTDNEATTDIKENNMFLLAKSRGEFQNIELTQHCIRVGSMAYLFAKNIVLLREQLPRVIVNREIRKVSSDNRFRWQDIAYKKTISLYQNHLNAGFFGVNIASTGTGKTFANAKIMFALSGDAGCRFCFASGLRTLTLQTGKALKQKLMLDDDDMAVIMGDCLQGMKQTIDDSQEENNKFDDLGADWDCDEIWDDNLYVDYEGQLSESLQRFIKKKNKRVNEIISAPVLVCTIDTLVNCFENRKGGKQIPAVMRLMSSDLIIDEIDDFGLSDLPAVARLVYFAGMFGSRVLISSATLSRNLLFHLYRAYSAGRLLYNRANGIAKASTVFALYDEFLTEIYADCGLISENFELNAEYDYLEKSQVGGYISSFYNKRISNIAKKLSTDGKNIFEICPVSTNTFIPMEASVVTKAIVDTLEKEIYSLHDLNCVELLHSANIKRISVGVVRMANINPLVRVATEFLARESHDNYAVFGIVYHSRFPYLTRSYIEEKLDVLLKSRNSPEWEDSEIVQLAVKRSCKAENIILIVFASPVEEVGRDHDFDWAIIEPSSVRSIIQMAGRVRRHRYGEWSNINVGILSSNFKGLMKSDLRVFERPGYQVSWLNTERLNLSNSLLEMAMTFGDEDLSHQISSIPRIWQLTKMIGSNTLAAMEYLAVEGIFLDGNLYKDYMKDEKPEAVSKYWRELGCISFDIQRKSRFRYSPGLKTNGFVLTCDEDGKCTVVLAKEPDKHVSKLFNNLDSWCLTYNLNAQCIENKIILNINESCIIRYYSQMYGLEIGKICKMYNKFEVPITSSQGVLYYDGFLGVWEDKK